MTIPTLPPPVPETLAYSSIRPPRDKRPGVLTALAIVSIVIGGFSVLNGVGGVVSAVMLYAMSGMTFPPPGVVPPPPTPAPTTSTTVVTGSSVAVNVVATSPGPGAVTSFRFGSPSVGVMVMTVADGVVRVGLAGLLIAAGILVLRDHRLGHSLHLWWAWMRLPVALAGGFVTWQTSVSMMNNFAAPAGAPIGAIQGAMVFGTVMQVVLACAYPVAVLIVLRSSTVRRYYAELAARVSTGRGMPEALAAG